MRILILSSSTGGGHDMRARSLEQWCTAPQIKPKQITTHRYQALEDSAPIYRFGVELYNWIQKNCPALHHLYFNYLEVFQVSAHERLLLGKKHLIAVLRKTQPDVIISVHAHTNHAFRAIAHRTLPNVKFVTYCGELFGGYGFSRHWVDPQADAFIGATQEICSAAEQLGMPTERTHFGGFLLNPKFYSAPLESTAKAQLRQQLNLEDGKCTLLLSTGANGANNHPQLIRALEAASLEIQVIALCGRNAQVLTELESLRKSRHRVSVRPLGYREDMFELMQIADAIVARPGTGTTSEAIQAGCPLILNTLGGVMPQEWITVKYLRAQGLPAQRLKKASDLAQLVEPLTSSPAHLAALKQRMQALRPKRQPSQIIDTLVDLLNQ